MPSRRFLRVVQPDLSRRGALGLLALASATVACGSSSAPVPTVGEDTDPGEDTAGDETTPPENVGECATTTPGTDRGAVGDFPLGTWRLLTAGRAIIGHDERGLFAFSALCTHSSCVVGKPNATTGAILCPCHGSRFDGNGNVTAGPATRPLPHFAVTICADRVYVDSAQKVPADTRTAV